MYVLNTSDVYSFAFNYAGDKEKKVEFTHTFTDERVRVNIHLTKEDSETGKTAQGDATLEGAVYGLYAREAYRLSGWTDRCPLPGRTHRLQP